jgi:hypothetical protein
MPSLNGTNVALSLLLSGALLLATWALAHRALLRLPPDYLVDAPPAARRRRVLRTAAGLAVMGLGVALLVLPGPGLLLLLVGAGLCELPGRARLARWVLGRPAVRRSVNELRRRHGLAPLEDGPKDERGHDGCSTEVR